MFFRLTAVANLSTVSLIVNSWGIEKIMMFGVDLGLMGEQLINEGRPGFPMFWKLTRRQENARSAISKDVMVFDLQTAQLGHGNRVHFGRRDFAVAQ